MVSKKVPNDLIYQVDKKKGAKSVHKRSTFPDENVYSPQEPASISHASVRLSGSADKGANEYGKVNVSHEIASANELNMFVPKEVIGNYYDVSCSLDYD